jgi:hypothetical protein
MLQPYSDIVPSLFSQDSLPRTSVSACSSKVSVNGGSAGLARYIEQVSALLELVWEIPEAFPVCYSCMGWLFEAKLIGSGQVRLTTNTSIKENIFHFKKKNSFMVDLTPRKRPIFSILSRQ